MRQWISFHSKYQGGKKLGTWLILRSSLCPHSVGAQCPTNYNPADFYVQVLAIVPGRESESRERIGKICDSFATSKVARDMEQLLAAKAQTQALEQPENGYTYKATWFMQFRAVLWRSWLSVLKEPLLVKVRLIQTTVSTGQGRGGR